MAWEFVTIKDASDIERKIIVELIGADTYAQAQKLAWGSDGVLTNVEAATPLPVVVTGALPAGSNLIGQVDLNSVPAAARTTDSMSAVLATDAVMINLTTSTPKFAKANITAPTTDGAVVTAVGGKKIRVLSFRLHAAGTATNATFNSKSGGAGTAISELFALGANGGRAEALNIYGHFETVSGEGLTLTTGTGSAVGVGVVYVEV